MPVPHAPPVPSAFAWPSWTDETPGVLTVDAEPDYPPDPAAIEVVETIEAIPPIDPEIVDPIPIVSSTDRRCPRWVFDDSLTVSMADVRASLDERSRSPIERER